MRHLFQPVVPLGAAPGWSEALVRWQLEDGTIRGPLDILPYWLAPTRLERFTSFTLERAARGAVANPTARVSVNLSPAQVLLPSTLNTLKGMVRTVSSRLHIEITEQVHTDGGALADRLRQIKELSGVVLLDDVTPVDLEARLRFDAPIDGVKIDRSVVLALLGRPVADVDQATAVSFVEEVTARFPLVVAEGVEDPNASEELAARGISHVQGFGIAKPAPELRSEAGVSALARRRDGTLQMSNAPSDGIGMTADGGPNGWPSR